MLMADYTQLLVAGEVVGTLDFDPGMSERVSLIRVDSSLYGDVGAGDTLLVNWRTGRRVHEDGTTSYSSEPGPQVSELTAPHIWFLMGGEDGLWCAGYPLHLSSTTTSKLERYLGWAQQPRVPYAGAISDSTVARKVGLDPVRGDDVRAKLTEYLSEYLARLASDDSGLGRSN
jgi:hypothetical protein